MKSLALQGKIAIGRNHKRSKKRYDSGEDGLDCTTSMKVMAKIKLQRKSLQKTKMGNGYHGETLKLVHSESETISL